jgi:uncharacterized protein YndB with AHSA1/START domain
MTSPTRFRRWALATLGVIVGLVLLLVVVGMLLPREHTARASIELAASPERVWAVVSDFAGAARWRPDLESVRLDTAPGRPFRFVETTHEGELPFEVVSQDPPRRQVVRVIDDGLPFGGTWTWELVPLGAGTGLTLTEEGFTRNPIYRALGLVFFRPTESIARYLRALAAELGEDAERLTPREGFATVPRGKVWYRVVGDGPGVPLVVLHGGPGAPSYYLASLARLGAERPVVFYDQLGAGRSDQPSDTTL